MATGSFSPGPPRPGPSVPRFDPPILPPEERSGILFPLDVCWLLDTHEGQDEDIYARVEMDMGAARLRRKYSNVPHVRKAKIFLTADESKIFHEWYEWILGVGQLRWIGKFHDIGYGIRWFEAEFNKPWEAEYVALGEKNEDGVAGRAWKISVEVRLYGNGLISNPLLNPSSHVPLGSKFSLQLLSKSIPTVVKFFTGRYALVLTSGYYNAKLESSNSLALDSLCYYDLSMSSHYSTFLSSSSFIGGWARFDSSYSLHLI